MGNERADESAAPEHDPYAHRPGYVTDVNGRTDSTTTAAAIGVGAAFVTFFALGFLQVPGWSVWPVSAIVGVAVWLVLRARQRRRDRSEGRSPDAVAEARNRAVADANGGRRFFVAPNPVVVIVMGGVFVALAVGMLAFGSGSVGAVVRTVVLVASGAYFVVQGIGTLVVRRRTPGSH